MVDFPEPETPMRIMIVKLRDPPFEAVGIRQ
jgi:hypothetical protein